MSHSRRPLAVAALAAFVLSACSSEAGSVNDPDVPPPSTIGSSTSIAVTSTAAVPAVEVTDVPTTTVDPADEWAVDYVGGTPGPSSGDPIRIGFVNQASFSPESPPAAAAAGAYLNNDLGGVGGRPLELVECPVESESDAAACAAAFAVDPSMIMVLTGALQVGNQQLYDGIGTTRPILISTGLTSADFLSQTARTYTVGGAGVVAGVAHYIATALEAVPRRVAVIHLDSPAGNTAKSLFIAPIFERAGTPAVFVPIQQSASADDVEAAMTEAGAQDADVVFVVTDVAGCSSVYDALASLAMRTTVFAAGLCNSTPVGDHLRELGINDPVPDGWYFGSNGYSSYIPNLDAGVDTYLSAMRRYAQPAPGAAGVDTTGLAPLTFATTLTMAKVMNSLGTEATNPIALEGALASFAGPMMFQVGPLACGDTKILGVSLPAVCASQMGIQQYREGSWYPIADGNNGMPIDLSAI